MVGGGGSGIQGISGGASSGTGVTVTTSSTAIAAANELRRKLIIRNNSSTVCYIKVGAAATTSDQFLNQNDIFELDGNDSTSAVNGIVASGTADIRVLEL